MPGHFLAIIAISTFMMAFGTGVAAAQSDFSFDREYSYVDETKILHLLGEVTNESDEPIRTVLVSANFYDSNGNLLGEFKRAAELQTIGSGESSPFEILFLDQDASGKVANYTLSATAESSDENRERRLEVVSSNSRLDLLGTLYINAVARNTGDQTATNTIMIATLYDKDGRIIALGRALAEAVRGTADVPNNLDAPFGITVTEKLQTYKAAHYSLVVQSDQYVSQPTTFRLSAPGTSGGNQTQSGCLIATAAYGSEFVPQVQQLRGFRDNIVLQTMAGSSFIDAFNSWYYSFSPSVAEYERNSPWARDTVRIIIQPLLLILGTSASFHKILLTAGMGAEVAVIVTGMGASSLLGLAYLFPAAIFVGVRKRNLLGSKKLKLALAISWCFCFALVMVASVWSISGVMAIGTSALVLCCIATTILLVSDRVSRL